jgi:predicted nucleic-acid-binding Zn-ribbon protein
MAEEKVDASGPLTDDQRKLIQKWFDTKCPDFKCPICGNETFHGSDRVFTPIPISADGRGSLAFGVSLPSIAVVCSRCGHTLFFNALMIGVAHQPPRDKEAGNG